MGKKAKAMEERYIEMRRQNWSLRHQLGVKNAELTLSQKRVNELERTITKLKHPSNTRLTNIKDAPSQRAKRVVVNSEPAKLRKVQLARAGSATSISGLSRQQYEALANDRCFSFVEYDWVRDEYLVRWGSVLTSSPEGLVRHINAVLGGPYIYAKVVALSD